MANLSYDNIFVYRISSFIIQCKFNTQFITFFYASPPNSS